MNSNKIQNSVNKTGTPRGNPATVNIIRVNERIKIINKAAVFDFKITVNILKKAIEKITSPKAFTDPILFTVKK